MQFREAYLTDISPLHKIRMSVKENILSDPAMITTEDYAEFLTTRGKGWVCEMDNNIIGFAIADLKENNIWALFIHPDYEGKGIGRKLHNMMLDWYFEQTHKTIWLGTSPDTRAEKLYRKAGWVATGIRANGEIHFEMTYDNWNKSKQIFK